MKMWICADFADPSLIVKAPSPAGDKIHKHFLKFPLIVLLKPAVTRLVLQHQPRSICVTALTCSVPPFEWDAQTSAVP